MKDSMLAERELVLHSVETSSMLRFSLSRTCVQYSVQRVSRARCACVYRTAGLPLLARLLGVAFVRVVHVYRNKQLAFSRVDTDDVHAPAMRPRLQLVDAP